MTPDTQVNLAENDKGSFYNQKEWLEEYEYGKGMFYGEYGDDLRTSASIFSNKLFLLSIRSTEQLFLERPVTSVKNVSLKYYWLYNFPSFSYLLSWLYSF